MYQISIYIFIHTSYILFAAYSGDLGTPSIKIRSSAKDGNEILLTDEILEDPDAGIIQ